MTTTRETAERILKEMRDLQNNSGDLESVHIFADDLLCEMLKTLGYTEIVEAFEKIDKWYA